jgi:hypothetical protein
VLLAEGLTVESYLDTGNRAAFESAMMPTAPHPDFAARIWDAEGCAPLVVTGPRLEAAQRRLASPPYGVGRRNGTASSDRTLANILSLKNGMSCGLCG